MKGVILAGGTGSRLQPLTTVINKHLLPVYDRPMIYYPIECLAKMGIEEVLLVTGGHSAGDFMRLLGDGRKLGLRSLEYVYQDGAGGIAQALGLAERFANGEPIALVLGDNILEFTPDAAVHDFIRQESGARVLLSPVDTPQSFGIAEVENDRIKSIVEKPKDPPSNLAVIGVYFYDHRVFEIVRTLKPSHRNELEITDVNAAYLQRGELEFSIVQGWWVDAGETIDGYLDVCKLVAETGANHRPKHSMALSA